MFLSLCLQLDGRCLPPQMLITSLSSTYFPALTISLVSVDKGILCWDILPNISPSDHCLKLNPGTNDLSFLSLNQNLLAVGGEREPEYEFTHRLQFRVYNIYNVYYTCCNISIQQRNMLHQYHYCHGLEDFSASSIGAVWPKVSIRQAGKATI